jgi:hypothetical protein
MLAGPIERNVKLERTGFVDVLNGSSRFPAPRACAGIWVAMSDAAIGRREI